MVGEFTNYSQLGIPVWLIVITLIWTLIWKGLALWKSSRKNSKIWFVAILIINTLGILEILYIFLFSKIKLDKIETINKKPKAKKKDSQKNGKKTSRKTAKKTTRKPGRKKK